MGGNQLLWHANHVRLSGYGLLHKTLMVYRHYVTGDEFTMHKLCVHVFELLRHQVNLHVIEN